MNKVLAVPMALVFVLGLATVAQAAMSPPLAYPDNVYHAAEDAYGPQHGTDRCVGLSAGTAHHSCGTVTGGPAGGLH